MDIEKIKESKRKLEKEITHILRKFQEENKVVAKIIYVKRPIFWMNKEVSRDSDVEIKIKNPFQ